MLAAATGAADAGRALRTSLATRIAAVVEAVEGAGRPAVAALEWLDPVYIAGHWVPEMIDLAGGEDAFANPGERSRVAEWSEITASKPDVAVVMPCGYYVEQALDEALAHAFELGALGASQIFAVDAASSFSRPGPRLVDGVELLAHLLHPDRVPAPRGIGFQTVDVGAGRVPAG
jgi:iron complex transport system substrate-binding protein